MPGKSGRRQGSRECRVASGGPSRIARWPLAAAWGLGALGVLAFGAATVQPAGADPAPAAPPSAEASSAADSIFQAAHSHFQRGRSLEKLHRNTDESRAEFVAAYEGYTKAHEASPEGPLASRALYMAGSAKLFLDEPDDALALYQQVVDRYPGDRDYRAKALLKKAAVEKNTLRAEDARASLARYREIFPDGGPPEQSKEASRIAKSLQQIGTQATRIEATRWLSANGDPPNVGGKPALLYFWATWCPNCLKEVDFIKNLHERFGQRLRMVGVTNHSRGQTDASVEAYLAEHGLTFPNAVDHDGVTSAAYSAGVVPTAVLIDGAGVVRWHDHPAALTDAAIEALLAATTRPRS